VGGGDEQKQGEKAREGQRWAPNFPDLSVQPIVGPGSLDTFPKDPGSFNSYVPCILAALELNIGVSYMSLTMAVRVLGMSDRFGEKKPKKGTPHKHHRANHGRARSPDCCACTDPSA
jgi:hypothetical protein